MIYYREFHLHGILIPEEYEQDALNAIRKLEPQESFDSLEDALDFWDYETCSFEGQIQVARLRLQRREMGELDGAVLYEDKGDELLWSALAPFVQTGARIMVDGEVGAELPPARYWRFTFNEGRMYREWGQVVYDGQPALLDIFTVDGTVDGERYRDHCVARDENEAERRARDRLSGVEIDHIMPGHMP